jgi:molybdopterin synthase sulfur carrier subunit
MKLKVTVKYFGSVRDDSGIEKESLTINDNSTITEAISLLKEKHAALKNRKGQILFALNQNYSSEETRMKDGDELALFPVVSGG